MTTALEGGEWSAVRSGRTLPPGKTRHPLYRRLGGPQGRSGEVRKIGPPPGFDPEPSSPYSVAILTELPGPHETKSSLRKQYAGMRQRVVIAPQPTKFTEMLYRRR
jgi:hypothetical protein